MNVISWTRRKWWGELGQNQWRTTVSDCELLKRKKKGAFFSPLSWLDTKSLLLSSRGGRVISLKFSHSGFEVAFMKKLTGILFDFIFFYPRGQSFFTGSTGISSSKERVQVFIWPQQRGDLGTTLHVLCHAYTVHCFRTTHVADVLFHMTCVSFDWAEHIPPALRSHPLPGFFFSFYKQPAGFTVTQQVESSPATVAAWRTAKRHPPGGRWGWGGNK